MSKNTLKFFIITIMVSLLITFKGTCLAAEDTNEKEVVDEEIYDAITEVINLISKQLNNIDYKLDKARIMDEYERYPLIRLNIDSPYFGITNFVESKLKIKDSISTLDMARGYNIRSMINTKEILVEDIEVTKVMVFTTRKIKISKEMTKEDANICLTKLFEYLNQVKSTSSFLDLQLKSTFEDYYTEDKNITIMYIKNETKNIKDTLKNAEDLIIKNGLILSEDIREKMDKCAKFEESIEKFEGTIENPLSSETDLQNTLLEVISCKNEVYSFYEEEKKSKLDLKKESINIMLQNTLIDMDSKLNFFSNMIYGDNEDAFRESNDNFSTYSKNISSVKKYRDELSEILIANKNYLGGAPDYNEEQIIAEISKVYNIYLKFLNSYNTLLTQYIKNQMLKLKSYNTSYFTSSDSIVYLYVSAENELLEISNYFEKNNVYSNIKSIDNLIEILKKLNSIEEELIGESKV